MGTSGCDFQQATDLHVPRPCVSLTMDKERWLVLSENLGSLSLPQIEQLSTPAVFASQQFLLHPSEMLHLGDELEVSAL